MGRLTNREKEVVRMSDRQYRQAKALINDLCSNYDRVTGGCLLLDHGEVVQCPQMIMQSLVCRFFRDVLLEDKKGKTLKAEIMGDNHVKTCVCCGQPFRAISNRAKYCARCAGRVKKQQATGRKRKQRQNVTL